MDAATVNQYITETFPGVESVDDAGNRFFFAGPDRRMPFSTLVTGDRYDTASNLDRPGVFRLNIGLSRATYRSLFGAEPTKLGEDGIAETGEDFAALDRIMPHPVYAPQFWVCVLNPGPATFEAVQSLLSEAYERAARRQRAKPAPPEQDSEPG
jgi:hypothetical protein